MFYNFDHPQSDKISFARHRKCHISSNTCSLCYSVVGGGFLAFPMFYLFFPPSLWQSVFSKVRCSFSPKVPIKITEGLDPLSLLTDNATIAQWNNENLPSDRMSTENATILTNCERWPLMIDPQLQGVKWIKTREGEELRVVRLGQKGYGYTGYGFGKH